MRCCGEWYAIIFLKGSVDLKETILIGGYTRREGKGIYSLELDLQTEKLGNVQLLAHEPSPTYLAEDLLGHLYSVGSVDSDGGIAAFDYKNGNLVSLNHVVEPGAPLCYVGIDEQRDLIYGANYHLGQLRVYKRLDDGTLAHHQTIQHHGSGPHENQPGSRVHYSDLTPDNHVLVCDLGSDNVHIYEVDSHHYLHLKSSYSSAAGAGARHVVFHPTKAVFYLLCELNSTIEVVNYTDPNHLERLQTISLLPEDFLGENAAAAIRITKDGKFLYASNLGLDTITSFTVATDGREIQFLAHTSVEGSFPRDFSLSKNEDYLIVANQVTDNVVLFKRSASTGVLTLLQKDVVVPEGTCVLVKK
jgi:6-phosphogluconolactonase